MIFEIFTYFCLIETRNRCVAHSNSVTFSGPSFGPWCTIQPEEIDNVKDQSATTVHSNQEPLVNSNIY